MTQHDHSRPRPAQVFRILVEHFRPYRRRLIAITGLAIAGAGLEAAIVFLIAGLGSMLINGSQAIEKSFLGRDIALSRVSLCVVAVGAVLTRSVLDLVLVGIRASTDGKYDSDSRSRLISGFLDSDWDLQSEERTGGLQTATTTYVGQARAALQRLAEGVTNLISFVVLMAASLVAGGWAALVVLVVMALFTLPLRPLIEVNHVAAKTYRDTANGFAEKVEQIVRMAREIRVFAARSVIEEDALVESKRVGRSIAHMELASGRLGSLSTSITYLAAVGGLVALIALNVDSPQPYVAMVLLLYRAMTYGRSLQSIYQGLVASLPFVEALQERVARYESSRESFGSKTFADAVDDIEFDGVAYSYPGSARAVEDVSFDIRRGDAIGIVGPSGSGKSTLIQLLLGFRVADEGRVLVNGSAPTQYDLISWARHVTVVPQEALLFDSSVEENVRCFRPDITTDDVEAALRSAHMLDEVLAMPDGLRTNVGEGGKRLSGGQRQRVSLARALAGRPDVLVLDEPTSALDLVSEEAIRKTLQDLKGDLTMIIVAHRMSTLRLCDRVLVMNGGRLEANGPREDLENGNAYYAQAIKLAKLV